MQFFFKLLDKPQCKILFQNLDEQCSPTHPLQFLKDMPTNIILHIARGIARDTTGRLTYDPSFLIDWSLVKVNVHTNRAVCIADLLPCMGGVCRRISRDWKDSIRSEWGKWDLIRRYLSNHKNKNYTQLDFWSSGASHPSLLQVSCTLLIEHITGAYNILLDYRTHCWFLQLLCHNFHISAGVLRSPRSTLGNTNVFVSTSQ